MPHSLNDPTNDAMYLALRVLYPNHGRTLGDLLTAYWTTVGFSNNGAAGFEYYKSQSALGETRMDVAHYFWNNLADILWYEPGLIPNYLFEDGSKMVWEDGVSSRLGA